MKDDEISNEELLVVKSNKECWKFVLREIKNRTEIPVEKLMINEV